MARLNLGIPADRYPEKMLDRFLNKRLIVVGGARCVWDDMALVGVRGGADNNGYDVMCVNDIVIHYPGRVLHFYSNDHRWMGKWIDARRELHTRKYGTIRFTHSCGAGGEHTWPWPGHGSSALGAVYTGLAMGYSQIVLCGIPLDDSGHYFDPPWITTNFKREVGKMDNGNMMYWQGARDKTFENRVKSCSGRTRDLLGSP